MFNTIATIIDKFALIKPNAWVAIDIPDILAASIITYATMNIQNASITPSIIKSKIIYGIVRGLKAPIYPINIIFKPNRIHKEITGLGHMTTIKTNTNFLKYFNG